MEFLESLKGCAIRSLNLPQRKTQKVNKQKEEKIILQFYREEKGN